MFRQEDKTIVDGKRFYTTGYFVVSLAVFTLRWPVSRWRQSATCICCGRRRSRRREPTCVQIVRGVAISYFLLNMDELPADLKAFLLNHPFLQLTDSKKVCWLLTGIMWLLNDKLTANLLANVWQVFATIRCTPVLLWTKFANVNIVWLLSSVAY